MPETEGLVVAQHGLALGVSGQRRRRADGTARRPAPARAAARSADRGRRSRPSSRCRADSWGYRCGVASFGRLSSSGWPLRQSGAGRRTARRAARPARMTVRSGRRMAALRPAAAQPSRQFGAGCRQWMTAPRCSANARSAGPGATVVTIAKPFPRVDVEPLRRRRPPDSGTACLPAAAASRVLWTMAERRSAGVRLSTTLALQAGQSVQPRNDDAADQIAEFAAGGHRPPDAERKPDHGAGVRFSLLLVAVEDARGQGRSRARLRASTPGSSRRAARRPCPDR